MQIVRNPGDLYLIYEVEDEQGREKESELRLFFFTVFFSDGNSGVMHLVKTFADKANILS